MIRLFDLNNDITKIIPIIETSFGGTLDEEGRNYLQIVKNLYRNQEGFSLSNPMYSILPSEGLVFEEDGQVVGNLTLTKFLREGVFYYFISNVAVLPRFRERGIARQLTQAALSYAKNNKAEIVFLQVREENIPAYTLYISLGFEVYTKRITWQRINPQKLDLRGTLSKRKRRDWATQRTWFAKMHPELVRMFFDIEDHVFQPNFVGQLFFWKRSYGCSHFSIFNEKQIGFFTLNKSLFDNLNVWLAPDPDCRTECIQKIIPWALEKGKSARGFRINYPADLDFMVFQSAGFSAMSRLVWMTKSL